MEKYLVPATPPSQTPNESITRRPRWKRSLLELIGKFDSKCRHDIFGLAMQSYCQIGAFPHAYHIDSSPCQTHVEWFAGGSNNPRPTARASQHWNLTARIDALFDKGYIWPQLQVSLKNHIVKEDETKQVLHISAPQPLDVVKWNLANQYEVACASRKSGELHIYDIGYISLEPVEVLRKRPTIGVHGCVVPKGLSDIAFSSNHKSSEDSKDIVANGQHKQNKFIPLSEAISACTAHPLHGAIVAGTKQSSLLLLSQGFMQCREGDDSPI